MKKQAIDKYQFAENEVAILNRLCHPNVLSIYKNWNDAGKSYILMEHLSGGSLYDLLCEAAYNDRRPMEEEVCLYM